MLPPEDADCIVDLVSTGATLRANGLVECGEVLRSSTRLYANRKAMERPESADRIERIVMLVRSVLDARRRVMVELNVAADRLDAVVGKIPCMREPTVAQLASGLGFAVRAAVATEVLATLVPDLKAAGGTDIVVTKLAQIVP